MKNRIFLKFERRSEIVEVGGVAVLIEEGETMEDAIERAKEGDFVEFLTTDRAYLNSDWSFGPFDPEEEDSDTDSPAA